MSWLRRSAWVLGGLLLIGLFVFFTFVLDSDDSGSIRAGLIDGGRPPAPSIPAAERLGETGAPDCSGKVCIVNFWASWCGPCRDEAPILQRLHDEFEARGALVVGLNAQDLTSDALAFLDEHELDYPNVRVARDVEEAWQVRGFPETFIVGRDGKIAAKIDGPVTDDRLRSILDKELA